MPKTPVLKPTDDQGSNPDHRESHDAIPVRRPTAKIAALIANGEMPFPESMESTERLKLAAEVGRRRRAKLVRFIARAIAEDIHRSRAP